MGWLKVRAVIDGRERDVFVNMTHVRYLAPTDLMGGGDAIRMEFDNEHALLVLMSGEQIARVLYPERET
jgi:hypothetical protein